MTAAPSFTPARLLLLPFVGATTWLVHEGAHFAMGTALGYEMWVSLNQAGLASGTYDPPWHGQLVTAAGPLVTYLQALLGLWIVLRRQSFVAYAFLFFAAFMRLVAFLVSFAHPNDEARLSLTWGLPMWALPAIVVAILIGMTVMGGRRVRIGWKGNMTLYAVASAVAAAFVLGDQALRA